MSTSSDCYGTKLVKFMLNKERGECVAARSGIVDKDISELDLLEFHKKRKEGSKWLVKEATIVLLPTKS